ncbi:MAG: acyltransferase domain-containing protein, partial [Thermoplasmata archaeon]
MGLLRWEFTPEAAEEMIAIGPHFKTEILPGFLPLLPKSEEIVLKKDGMVKNCTIRLYGQDGTDKDTFIKQLTRLCSPVLSHAISSAYIFKGTLRAKNPAAELINGIISGKEFCIELVGSYDENAVKEGSIPPSFAAETAVFYDSLPEKARVRCPALVLTSSANTSSSSGTSEKLLKVVLYHREPGPQHHAPLPLILTYRFDYTVNELIEDVQVFRKENNIFSAMDFYRLLWLGFEKGEESTDYTKERRDEERQDEKYFTTRFKLTDELIAEFCRVTGNRLAYYSLNGPSESTLSSTTTGGRPAPADMGFIVGWKGIISALLKGLPENIGMDIFKLVHLSTETRVLKEGLLKAGVELEGVFEKPILALYGEGENSGILAQINGIIRSGNMPLLELKNTFLIRDKEAASHFRQWCEKAEIPLTSCLSPGSKGGIDKEGVNKVEEVSICEIDIKAPEDMRKYAIVSADTNPIHIEPAFARLAGFSTPIVHGMWTSSAVRAVIESAVCPEAPARVVSYRAEFLAPVIPGEVLTVYVSNVGMAGGFINIAARAVSEKSGEVLKAYAQVKLPPTFYAYVGQGDPSSLRQAYNQILGESEVARRIIDRAEEYFRTNFGFSLLEIISENPKEIRIYFGGEKGERIRKNYMAFSYTDASGQAKRLFPDIDESTFVYTFRHPDGLINATQFTQPAILLLEKACFETMRAAGCIDTDSFFAGHSLGEYGVLISLLGDNYTDYPLHSDSGSPSKGQFPMEFILLTTFLRGLTMQMAVPRDAEGKSPYGMVVIKPHKVCRGFDEKALLSLVSAIEEKTGHLLEVVNFNVPGKQYSVVGTLSNLVLLGDVLERINRTGNILAEDSASGRVYRWNLYIEDGLSSLSRKPLPSLTTLQSEFLIPLNVDVPFHSKALSEGVRIYRELLKNVFPQELDLSVLSGRYIPNLTGEPFSLTEDYLRKVLAHTESPVIKELLDRVKEVSAADRSENIKEKEELLLKAGRDVLIEHLAYHIARPVQWTKTMDFVFGKKNTRPAQRMVEIGHRVTLSPMAKQVLQESKNYLPGAGKEVFFYLSDKETIHRGMSTAGMPYLSKITNPSATLRKSVQEKTTESSVLSSSSSSSSSTSSSSTTTSLMQSASSAATSTGTSTSTPFPQQPATEPAVQHPGSLPATPAASTPALVPDRDTKSIEVLRVMLALKLKKSLDEIDTSKSIKELVGGKSALQNEIFGDLVQEFGNLSIDGAADMPLSSLAEQLSSACKGLGKFTKAKINSMFSATMPAGFTLSTARAYLSQVWGAGEGLSASILLHSLTMDAGRRLQNEGEAKQWLDSVVEDFTRRYGVGLKKTDGQKAMQGGGAAAIDPAALDSLKQHLKRFAQSIDEACTALKEYTSASGETRSGGMTDSKAIDDALLHIAEAEHGVEYLEGLKPIFSKPKARVYDSWWSWVLQDETRLYYDLLNGRISPAGAEAKEAASKIINRASERLLEVLEYRLNLLSSSRVSTSCGPEHIKAM